MPNDNIKPFPKLMTITDKSQGDFVIYVDRLLNGATGFGMVVKSVGHEYQPGVCSDSWDLSQFEDYSGTVTLHN